MKHLLFINEWVKYKPLNNQNVKEAVNLWFNIKIDVSRKIIPKYYYYIPHIF